MRKPSFDYNGYLIESRVEVDLEDLKCYFVDDFVKSKTRNTLFDNYLRFTYRFQDEVFPYFEQWIDGSFVTQKLNPKDIDIVTFVDYLILEKRGDQIIDQFLSFSLESQSLDSYIVPVYPENHPDFPIYQSERNLWLERFNTDRDSRPKGFVSLSFSK